MKLLEEEKKIIHRINILTGVLMHVFFISFFYMLTEECEKVCESNNSETTCST